jgi:photosystem II stability/assembly factor-like uncharacterized protein
MPERRPTRELRRRGGAPVGAGGSPSGRQRPWLIGVVVATLAVASITTGWWVGQARAAEPRPVERFTHIHGLDAPAWAGGDLLVATHHGLVRRTPDGGWFLVGETQHDLMGFRAHASAADVLYGSGHPDLRTGLPNPVGLIVSRDGGLTWQSRSLAGQVDFHALSVQQSDGNVIVGFNVGTGFGILRSLDGGESWSALPSEPVLATGSVTSLDVHPTDPDTILAATPTGLWVTHDAGRTWTVRAFEGSYVTAVRYAPGAPDRVYAYAATAHGGLMASDDAAATWSPLGLRLTGNDAIGHIAAHPDDADVLYAGSYGMDLFATHDGGANWEVWAERGVPR